MKLEWGEPEPDYGLEEAAFYDGPPAAAPPQRKHVSFSLRLDLVSICILFLEDLSKYIFVKKILEYSTRYWCLGQLLKKEVNLSSFCD